MPAEYQVCLITAQKQCVTSNRQRDETTVFAVAGEALKAIMQERTSFSLTLASQHQLYILTISTWVRKCQLPIIMRSLKSRFGL